MKDPKGYTVSYATTDAEIMQVNLKFDKRFNEKCPDCGTFMGQTAGGLRQRAAVLFAT